MMVQQGRSSLALVWGLVGGVVYLAVATLAHFVGVAIERQIGALTIGQLVLVVLELAIFVTVGVLASGRSARIESGALAGVVAGLVVGIGSFLLLLGGALLLRQQIHAQGLHTAALRAIYIAALVRSAIGIAVSAVIGLALGALGGLVGRGSAADQPPAGQPYAAGPGVQHAGVAGGFGAPQGPRYPGGDAPTIPTPQPPQ